MGWAYASTVYGAQGVTVDHAVVLLDPSFDRHSAYVAASRARIATEFVVDAKAIDSNRRQIFRSISSTTTPKFRPTSGARGSPRASAAPTSRRPRLTP